jgi:hypothetical protein
MKKKIKYRVIFTAINMGTNVTASSKIKAKLAAIHKLKLDPLAYLGTEIMVIIYNRILIPSNNMTSTDTLIYSL